MKQQPPRQVAKALSVNVGQVYLVKHRTNSLFKAALKDAAARLHIPRA